jgi:sugar phosphate permease
MMLVAYFDRVNISVAGKAIMADLHVSRGQFGVVLSAFTFGYALLQIPGGYLADRIGSKPVLIAALLIWSLFTAVTGMVSGLTALLATRILFGVGEGIENGAQFKLIGDHFDDRSRSQANAVFLTALALGPAIATPLSTHLLVAYGWRELFYSFAFLGIVVAGLLLAFLPSVKAEAFASKKTDWRSLGFAIRQPKSLACILAYLLFNCAFWGFIGWVPTYLQEQRQISLKDLGTLGAAPYLCGFAGLLVFGLVGGKSLSLRRPLLVAGAYAAAAVSLYAALSANSVTGCVMGLSVTAFFLYGGFGPFWATAIQIAPEDSRGAFTGLINFGGQLGGFMAQITIGVLADRMHSFNGGIQFMVASLFLAALVMFRA